MRNSIGSVGVVRDTSNRRLPFRPSWSHHGAWRPEIHRTTYQAQGHDPPNVVLRGNNCANDHWLQVLSHLRLVWKMGGVNDGDLFLPELLQDR